MTYPTRPSGDNSDARVSAAVVVQNGVSGAAPALSIDVSLPAEMFGRLAIGDALTLAENVKQIRVYITDGEYNKATALAQHILSSGQASGKEACFSKIIEDVAALKEGAIADFQNVIWFLQNQIMIATTLLKTVSDRRGQNQEENAEAMVASIESDLLAAHDRIKSLCPGIRDCITEEQFGEFLKLGEQIVLVLMMAGSMAKAKEVFDDLASRATRFSQYSQSLHCLRSKFASHGDIQGTLELIKMTIDRAASSEENMLENTKMLINLCTLLKKVVVDNFSSGESNLPNALGGVLRVAYPLVNHLLADLCVLFGYAMKLTDKKFDEDSFKVLDDNPQKLCLSSLVKQGFNLQDEGALIPIPINLFELR